MVGHPLEQGLAELAGRPLRQPGEFLAVALDDEPLEAALEVGSGVPADLNALVGLRRNLHSEGRRRGSVVPHVARLCGGFLEMKKIAAMAEAYCVMVAPHNPMGPLATAVSAHFAACTPNFLVLENTPD